MTKKMIQNFYNTMEKYFAGPNETDGIFNHGFLKGIWNSIQEIRKTKKFIYTDDEENLVLIAGIKRDRFVDEMCKFNEQYDDDFDCEGYYVQLEEYLSKNYPSIYIEIIEPF